MAKNLQYLKIQKGKIVGEEGKPVMLKGVSLGGWLMMEGYMFGGRNIPGKAFRESFETALGRPELDELIRSFREVFIREEDIETIKSWGANCVRIPFNYRLVEFEDRPFSLNEEGLGYLDRAVKWCEKHGLYCILDMHAAPGSQNPDWHSDCVGKPELFTDPQNLNRYYRLWHFLADRYKDSSAVAGYDILNEPVVPIGQESALKSAYEKVTEEIRSTGDRHIIFLEGNLYGQRIKFLGKPKDGNTAYSVHVYPPPPFVFNLEPGLHYPGKAYGFTWNKERLGMLARPYNRFIQKTGVPLYVGEFGVNARGGYFGELKWVKDILDFFEKSSWHWTYWTYKTVANHIHPDGIYRYTKNPTWVHREGPLSGWETFAKEWPKEKGRMIFSWRTENFTRNDLILSVLKKYF